MKIGSLVKLSSHYLRSANVSKNAPARNLKGIVLFSKKVADLKIFWLNPTQASGQIAYWPEFYLEEIKNENLA